MSELNEYKSNKNEVNFNFIQKYKLKKSHPIGIIFDAITAMWVTYCVWNYPWPWAIMIFTLGKIISFFAVIDVDVHEMSETYLGKVGLINIHPTNFSLQALGALISYFGLWLHSAEYFFAGLSILLIGHMIGWTKVNSRYSKKLH